MREWNFSDGCGNVSPNFIQTITVEDTTAPIIQNITGDLDATLECSDSTAIANSLALVPTATDNCTTPIINLVSDDTTINPDCPNAYIRVRVWNFNDGCDNVSPNFTQTITVEDTTAPVLVLPSNVSAECSDDLSPIAFGEATATDNCDINPVITFNDVMENGACIGTFRIVRTWTATDACGNTVSENQTISTSDTTPPVFDQTTLPSNVVVECNAIPEPVTLTASDNCGTATVTVSDTRVDGNCQHNYTINRSYTATDECGIKNTHIQIITVQDTIAPEFVEALPVINRVVECDNIPEPETLTATDICGSATVSVSDKTVNIDANCPNSYTIERTWVATDICGLTTSFTQNIIVQDTTPPTFEGDLPENITVECDNIPNTIELKATDSCGNATVRVSDTRKEIDDNCPSSYIIERTWIAEDECRLQTRHVQIITVQDTEAPYTTTSYAKELNISCTELNDDENQVPELEFIDNCSSNIIFDYNETNSFDENVIADYQIIRTWTVEDNCGNSAEYTQTLNVSLDEIVNEVLENDRCFDDGVINLDRFLADEAYGGTWEIIQGNPVATVTGSIFDPTNLGDAYTEFFNPNTEGIEYIIRYTGFQDGCINVTDVTMVIDAKCQVLPCGQEDISISTAITPNGDGFNESFDIEGITLCGFVAEVQIFNRWGSLVFESNDYTLGSEREGTAFNSNSGFGKWNGTSNKSSFGNKGKLPNGTYYYIIKLRNSGLSPITGPIYLGTK